MEQRHEVRLRGQLIKSSRKPVMAQAVNQIITYFSIQFLFNVQSLDKFVREDFQVKELVREGV